MNKKNELNNIFDKNYKIVEQPINNMQNDKVQPKQKKGLKRNVIDKFYTKPNIAEQCINHIRTHINISKNDLFIEPSAGNGSFIPFIKKLSKNHRFYDIEPEHTDILKQDYLELDHTILTNRYKQIHIIGNPPFGRQSSLTIKFIKFSCEYANSISFILPKSFRKESMQSHFNEYFHLIFEIDLEEKAFLVNNIEYNVPCIFQIWKKETFVREKVNKLEPKNFIFVKKNDSPHISFRRVGVNAGIFSTDIVDKSIQSHYFIKFTNSLTIDKNIEKLKNIKFDENNTVGPKSISKQELILEFNKLL
jgi:hypothetical protein